MAIEKIARLVGHSSSVATESVYRQDLKPVIEYGVEAMGKIFGNGKKPKPTVRRLSARKSA